MSEPGTKVEAVMGVASLYVSSVPSAQIDCLTAVVQSESLTDNSEGLPESWTGLRFTEMPAISARVSMFD